MVKMLKILWAIGSEAPKCVNDEHMEVQRLDEYGREETGHL